jgi:hypothetical protein
MPLLPSSGKIMKASLSSPLDELISIISPDIKNTGNEPSREGSIILSDGSTARKQRKCSGQISYKFLGFSGIIYRPTFILSDVSETSSSGKNLLMTETASSLRTFIKIKQEFLGRTYRLLSFDMRETAKKTAPLTILLFLPKYSLTRLRILPSHYLATMG